MRKFGLLAVVAALLNACTFAHDEEREFPETVKLSTVERTQFIPTLERKFDRDKNAIYAATLLMACDELEGEIDTPLTNIESLDLEKMFGSESHQGVLEEGDYLAELEVTENKIKARAFFRKSLPFEEPVERNFVELKFKNHVVESFGFNGKHHHIANVLYYKNENDFAVSLDVRDSQHEIVFIKTDFGNRVKMTKELKDLKKRTDKFQKARTDSTAWMYRFNDKDVFAAPVMGFSIETDYPDMAGTTFMGGEQLYQVEKVYQRTSMLLDEKGGEIESEGAIEVEAVEEPEEEVQIVPRKFYMDNNFMVMFKRKNSYYPYFAMYVTNEALFQFNNTEHTNSH